MIDAALTQVSHDGPHRFRNFVSTFVVNVRQANIAAGKSVWIGGLGIRVSSSGERVAVGGPA